jgi:hypothetical protein
MSVSSGITQEGEETILAGNQQGFVFKLEQKSAQNSPSLFINTITINATAPFTVIGSPNHNLPDGSWVKLTGITGTTYADGVSLNDRNFKISFIDANSFSINEFDPLDGGIATGSSYSYTSEYFPVIPGSVQINIGALVFTDPGLDGILEEASSLGAGTINYNSGLINISFTPAIGATSVFIRLVSYDDEQEIEPVLTTGAYTGGGLITKISNIDIQTKIFNFFEGNKKARLSRIDFYTQSTDNGQFTCNVFGDSSNVIINTPLADNLQSNVVQTFANQYQIGTETETIYRLYCHATAQTVQLQLTLSDRQMSVDVINEEPVILNAMMMSLRPAGRQI